MLDFGCVEPRHRWLPRVALALVFFSGVLGPATTVGTTVRAADPPPPGTITTGVPGPRVIRRLGELGPGQPRVAPPVRLKIPAIRVDAVVEHVGKAPDGSMDVPKKYEDTAWYQPGARPGEPGNAAIAGHVDSTTGRAVFWDLRKLVRGDQIIVVGEDGVERRFVVTDMGKYATADVPLNRLFGPATSSHLNLITCDATTTFNRTTESYDGNFIVYADAVP